GSAQADFDIPAGPLAPALAHFGQSAHILLSYPTALTEGRSTSGLAGRFDIDQGLAILLAGTGLEASRGANASYSLQASASTG
uniref:Ferric-pseudobactin BN7/BN8 receptor n=1 Tax=Pseudomonas capeferrum TaxID=1495066 RepID=UPI0013DD86E3|nr:Chain B, Ferric-pseudobactin BN7/BN8 receptor [Pseudomonas capeferrum]6OVM_B Chain B, Ferric-pseudobactin BN7/BN8 receptor [Pseudomonas capeferrum]